MSEIKSFQQRLKRTNEQPDYKLFINERITSLKTLAKDIEMYKQTQKIGSNDRISQMQIAIYNNLACLFQKKNKYRTSLHYLKVAENLEHKYFNEKYNDRIIPIEALQKLSTTYSNLSAIQSKLNNYKQALENIQFAIQVLRKDEELIEHKSLTFLYYNYSFLLQIFEKYNEASKYSLQGYKLAIKYADNEMIKKYEQLLTSLKAKLGRKEIRKQKEIKKYLNGEIGVMKRVNTEFEGYLKTIQKIEIKDIQPKYETIYKTFKSKPFLSEERRRSDKPSSTFYHSKLRPTYSNKDRLQRASSYNVRKQQSLKNRVDSDSNSTLQPIKQAKIYSQNNNKTLIPIINTGPEIIATYGLADNNRRNKMYRTFRQGKIDTRMKHMKKRLLGEIQQLHRKNQTLQKIMDEEFEANYITN